MKFILSKSLLLFFSLFIIIGTLGIITDQVDFLLKHYQLNFVPGEISLEENIAILLAAFGAFLELRPSVTEHLYENSPPAIEIAINDIAQLYGVYIILLAISIECIDLGILALETWSLNYPILKFIEIFILFSLNLVAVILLIKFFVKILRPIKKTPVSRGS